MTILEKKQVYNIFKIKNIKYKRNHIIRRASNIMELHILHLASTVITKTYKLLIRKIKNLKKINEIFLVLDVNTIDNSNQYVCLMQ